MSMTTMRKIRCMAIDDEPIALMVIARFCERYGGIELQTFCEPMIGLDAVVKENPTWYSSTLK